MEFKDGAAELALADGTKVTIRQRDSREQRTYWSKTRMYVWGVTAANRALAEQERELPAPKQRGEDPANDAAYDAFNRAFIKASRVAGRAVLEELGTELTAGLDLTRGMRFSRTAGCSCPCSPGLILDGHVRLGGRPVDFYVTLAA